MPRWRLWPGRQYAQGDTMPQMTLNPEKQCPHTVLQAGLAGYEETREFQQDFESTTQESQGLSLLQDGKEWSTR